MKSGGLCKILIEGNGKYLVVKQYKDDDDDDGKDDTKPNIAQGQGND